VQSKWVFAELHAMIAPQALMYESMEITIDAHDSSQAYPRCGHTARENRPNNGLLFVCQNCQYTLHADLIGARTMTMRTILVRQDWMRTGHLFVAPLMFRPRKPKRHA
jgi:putative transposase